MTRFNSQNVDLHRYGFFFATERNIYWKKIVLFKT